MLHPYRISYTAKNIRPVSGCYLISRVDKSTVYSCWYNAIIPGWYMILRQWQDTASDTGLIKNQVSKIQDDSHRIIAPISCIMPSFHKPNLTDIIGCVCMHVCMYACMLNLDRESWFMYLGLVTTAWIICGTNATAKNSWFIHGIR